MYCNHYGFSEKPFDVTPDPRFLYLTSDHRETLASLIYGIQERRGFITIVGEVGTGKTTLLNAALDRLDDNTRVAFIFNTDVTFNEMLSMALYEWGLIKPKERLSKINAIQRLNNFAIQQIAKGGTVVLIVDEAQNLDNSVMENLRLLSNLETRKHKLVQIVLSGQPELDTTLDQHELRQFAQRISLRRYIFPLSEKDTYAYLQHRLTIVKHSGSSLFTIKAQKLIWEYSSGIPRKINILCDNALLIGYGLKQKKIQAAVVQEVAEDLKWSRFSDTKASSSFFPPEIGDPWTETKPPRRRLTVAKTMVLVGILVIAGGFFLGSPNVHFSKLSRLIKIVKGQPLNTVNQQSNKQPLKKVGTQKNVMENIPVINASQKVHAKSENQSGIETSPEMQTDPYVRVSRTSENRVLLKDEETIGPNRQPSAIVYNGEEKHAASRGAKEIVVKKKIINQRVKVKKGETLSRLMIQTYGGYDKATLVKVLQENPDVIDPDLILAGQVLKLPVNRGQMSGIRD